MSNIKKLYFLLAAFILIGGVIIMFNRPGKTLASDDSDYIAIEKTLHLYLEIDAEIQYSLDDSRLREVLANDPRGSYTGTEGANKHLVKLVQWYTGNPNIKEDEIRMLDFWNARYAYNRAVKQIYDNAVAMGALPTPTPAPTEDPFDIDAMGVAENAHSRTPQTSPESLPEIQALMEETGIQYATLPPPRPEKIVPEQFSITSITIDEDLAHMVGDYQWATVDLTFAKINGCWYLIGSKIIQWHGG